LKLTRAKLTGGVAQDIECLLYRPEALSSNPNFTNNKKTLLGKVFIYLFQNMISITKLSHEVEK
jgi:hypothetical protein